VPGVRGSWRTGHRRVGKPSESMALRLMMNVSVVRMIVTDFVLAVAFDVAVLVSVLAAGIVLCTRALWRVRLCHTCSACGRSR
jgi:hypothetical protein